MVNGNVGVQVLIVEKLLKRKLHKALSDWFKSKINFIYKLL
jgi:hypothetical protein